MARATRPRSKASRPLESRAAPRSLAGPPPASQALAAIYAVVRAIPRGKIATYGQIAALAGLANGHRIAARAMRECPDGLPWQRVLGKKDARRAQVNIADQEHALLQRRLLEREGVVFDEAGLTLLARFGWLPLDYATPRSTARDARSTKHPARSTKHPARTR